MIDPTAGIDRMVHWPCPTGCGCTELYLLDNEGPAIWVQCPDCEQREWIVTRKVGNRPPDLTDTEWG